ncbi:MAG: Long-chain-fatty-acid--CoA ligase [Candidatus Bipolaricaulis sibiricus]|uniref:Long-chain-fatty-acid--CoA ligase n=1 Tax=Bipolaricaulis sibiricus TaxID=2501609 RepID=A0A410FV75_BIPS1|nr:MAG: Long-chain-fatty-acid--CoA ligase [Candidatus Bipolaricaulis sibiricus]
MSGENPYRERPWVHHYAEGVPPRVDTPAAPVWSLLDHVAQKFPRRAALHYYGTNLSYGELREQVGAFAAGLGRLGVQKGDRVALYLVNSPQFVIAYFGILMAGATVVPVSPVYSSSELAFQMKDSAASYVVCQDLLYGNVARAQLELKGTIVTGAHEYLPALKGVFAKKAALPEGPSVHPFQKILRGGTSGSVAAVDPEADLAALPYTGGTSAQPKGVRLTHANLVSCSGQLRAFFPNLTEGGEVVAAALPLYHIYGQVGVLLMGITLGATLVMFTSLDLGHILSTMDRQGVTVFYGVPALYEVLRTHAKTAWVNWKKMKLIVSGADSLPETTAAGWEERTGKAILEGFGMTETSGVSHVNPHHRIRRGSFGLPLPNVDAAIVEPETGQLLPVGEVGELLLSGPNITAGYWRRDEENRRAFIDRDGKRWLRTGDLVRMDGDGYFHYYARTKDLIKYRGFSVFLREIEEVLTAHPMVKAAGVIGVKDPKVGEYPMAYVVLKPEARGRVTEADIREYLKEKLAPYKVPKVVEFRSELPKTDVGKVSRRDLRDELEGL